MIVDTAPLHTAPSRLGDFGAASYTTLFCSDAGKLLTAIDAMRDTMYDRDLGNEPEADEAAMEINNRKSMYAPLFGTQCEVDTARLRNLAERMQAKLVRVVGQTSGAVAVQAIGLPAIPPTGEGLSTVAKVGLGLGALALGGVAVALIVRK